MQRYLAWRIGRRDYWVGLAAYGVAYFAVFALVSPWLATTALPFVWMLTLAVPRLRDIGWSAWWAIAPYSAGFIFGFLNAVAARIAGEGLPAAPVVVGMIGWASIAFMIALGFKRSRFDAAEVFG